MKVEVGDFLCSQGKPYWKIDAIKPCDELDNPHTGKVFHLISIKRKFRGVVYEDELDHFKVLKGNKRTGFAALFKE